MGWMGMPKYLKVFLKSTIYSMQVLPEMNSDP